MSNSKATSLYTGKLLVLVQKCDSFLSLSSKLSSSCSEQLERSMQCQVALKYDFGCCKLLVFVVSLKPCWVE